jgi:hypothetical protein
VPGDYFLSAKNILLAEISRQIVKVYGDGAINEMGRKKWCLLLKEGRSDLHDDVPSGRPSLVMDDLTENVRIQINHQPDATIFQFIILTFIYSSTCFGRFPAHHQELNDRSGSLWLYLRIMVIVVLCS